VTRPDLPAIVQSATPFAIFWLLMVAIPTVTGYPGVICGTPVAWLMGANAGQRCVVASRSPRPRWPLVEAAASGALLGLWQGLVMLGVGLFASDVPEDARGAVALAAVGIAAAGAFVSGGLALAFGAVRQRRLV
jgi:hypothetical protein